MTTTNEAAIPGTSRMLSQVIRSIFDIAPGNDRYPYFFHYNTLLFQAFPMLQFSPSIAFLDHDLHTMVIHLKTTSTTQFPVFVFLIAPDNVPVTSKNAELTMLELLKGADAPIKVTHGVCVCGSQAAFYQYNREKQVVSPEPQGLVHFDLDLATESGAKRFAEVAAHVEQMCRDLVPDLRPFPPFEA